MPIIVPDLVSKHQPTNWGRWSELAREGHVPSAAGFDASALPGDLNRFRSRYRMAHAFQGVQLEGFGEETKAGYNALLRLFLTWSAFELFMRVTGATNGDLDALLKPYNPEAAVAAVRRLDPSDRYFTMIRRHVNKHIGAELDKYLAGQPISVIWLIRSLRQIFAHGTLTPNADKVKPWMVQQICDVCCGLLFRVMDEEFSRRVIAYSNQLEGTGPGS